MTTQFITDDFGDLMIFGRDQLLQAMARISNRVYPSLKYTRLMPVVQLQGYEWENAFEVVEFDAYGIATIMADSANDGGLVGVVARRNRYPIKTVSDFTRIPWLHLQQARAKKIPIDAKYAAALIAGIERKHNSLAYDGDPDYGLMGLFTSQLPRLTQAQTFQAAFNAGATPDIGAANMLALLNSAVNTVIRNVQGIWLPKVLALPTSQLQLLQNTPLSGLVGKSVLNIFKENQAELGQITDVVMDDTLVGRGDNGTDAMLLLPGNSSLNPDQAYTPTGDAVEGLELHPIYFAIARDFDIPTEFQQLDDTIYRERALTRVAAVIVEDPRSGLIVSGI
jgi:hypothetical protein